MKPFNKALIWGRIAKFQLTKTKNKKPYVEIVVDCPDKKRGDVQIFCRLWGADNVRDFIETFKMRDKAHLVGTISQYKGRGDKVKTNFNVFKVHPWEPGEGQHKENRAVFILLGKVAEFNDDDGDGILQFEIAQDPGNGYDDTGHLFELTVPARNLLKFPRPEPGDVLRIKGRIEANVDEFGDVKVAAHPVVMEITKQGDKAEEGEAPF